MPSAQWLLQFIAAQLDSAALLMIRWFRVALRVRWFGCSLRLSRSLAQCLWRLRLPGSSGNHIPPERRGSDFDKRAFSAWAHRFLSLTWVRETKRPALWATGYSAVGVWVDAANAGCVSARVVGRKAGLRLPRGYWLLGAAQHVRISKHSLTRLEGQPDKRHGGRSVCFADRGRCVVAVPAPVGRGHPCWGGCRVVDPFQCRPPAQNIMARAW